jgi:hypothetical protein
MANRIIYNFPCLRCYYNHAELNNCCEPPFCTFCCYKTASTTAATINTTYIPVYLSVLWTFFERGSKSGQEFFAIRFLLHTHRNNHRKSFVLFLTYSSANSNKSSSGRKIGKTPEIIFRNACHHA